MQMEKAWEAAIAVRGGMMYRYEDLGDDHWTNDLLGKLVTSDSVVCYMLLRLSHEARN